MKTNFAREIVLIAYRVLDEHDSGREVDPMRLEWAQRVIVGSIPAMETAEQESEELWPI